MEQKYYSKRMDGFYVESIHGKNMPDDCVKITEKQHQEILNKTDDMEIAVDKGKVNLKEKVLSKDELLERVQLKIKKELDFLEQKLAHNETYFGTEGYDLFRNKVLEEISVNRVLLNSLEEKTIDELKVLLKEV